MRQAFSSGNDWLVRRRIASELTKLPDFPVHAGVWMSCWMSVAGLMLLSAFFALLNSSMLRAAVLGTQAIGVKS